MSATALIVGGLVLGGGAVALAASGGKSTSTTKRMPPPDRAPPPDVVTSAMMRTPATMPPAPPMSWQRIVIEHARAERTETGDAELPVPPALVVDDVGNDAWIVARMWLESSYAPARDENDLAQAFWSWSGPNVAGTTIAAVLKANQVAGQSGRRLSWVNAILRINVAGAMQLQVIYPGKTHTGRERGRDYLLVFDWRALQRPPA